MRLRSHGIVPSLLAPLIVWMVTGCISLDDIRNLPIETGSPVTVNVNVDIARRAARAALTKATCAIEEESQVNETITRIVGWTGMSISPFNPSWGIWCRFIIRRVDENKTEAFHHIRKRDPKDVFAENSLYSLSGNIDYYFKAYIEEFSDQPSESGATPGRP